MNLRLYLLAILARLYPLTRGQSSCRVLQPPLYGSFIEPCSNQFGSVCQFKCRPTFNLIGTCTRTCQPDGNWSGYLTLCINTNIPCPPLPLPVNSNLNGPCFNYAGGICLFNCTTGYTLSGSDVVYCTDQGAWSASPPTCVRQGCPPLQPPANGRMTGNCGELETQSGITQGSECSFTCNPGYMLVGPGKLTCIQSKWDGSAPVCRRIPCPPITRESAGFASVNDLCNQPRLGEICVAVCPPSTRADGEPSFRCTDNGWVTNFKSCSPIRCPSLTTIANGVTVGACQNDIKPADNCSYSCNLGYALVGTSLLTCLTNGQWDYKPPECILITCPRLSLSPRVRASQECLSGSETRPGTICNFSCEPCFNLIGSSTLACLQNGVWNGSAPDCRPVTCPPITAIKNGQTSGTCTEAATCQSVCTVQCNPGFIIGGTVVSSSLVCGSNGRWSGSVPQCIPEPTCPSLRVPDNAVTRGVCQGARRDQTCEFTCQACFNPIGITRVTCLQNGVWDNSFGSCSPITCPNPPLDTQLTGIGTCSNARCGDSCRFQCASGYQIQGNPTLNCNSNGRWDGPFPKCLVILCPRITVPQLGRASPGCEQARPGSRCAVTCTEGYRLVGPDEVICQTSGSWSPNPVFQCLPARCEDWPVPLGGIFINECPEGLNCPNLCPGIPGQSCNLRCGAGYRLVGTTEIVTCSPQTYQWTFQPLPTCQRINPPNG